MFYLFLLFCLNGEGQAADLIFQTSPKEESHHSANLGIKIGVYDSRALKAGLTLISRGDISYDKYRYQPSYLFEQEFTLQTRRHKLKIAHIPGGFEVYHAFGRPVSWARRVFVGGGIKVISTRKVPTSVYTDVGTSISLFGFVVETKYRVSAPYGDGRFGGFDGQPWLSLTLPF